MNNLILIGMCVGNSDWHALCKNTLPLELNEILKKNLYFLRKK